MTGCTTCLASPLESCRLSTLAWPELLLIIRTVRIWSEMNLKRLQRIMNEEDVDALVLNSPQNVFYTSGVGSTRPSFPNPTVYYEWEPIPIFSVVLRSGEPYLIYLEGTTETISDSGIKNKR